jgi:hypothetical protein
MPDHVFNRLTLQAHSLAKIQLLRRVLFQDTDRPQIDFGRVIAQPLSMEIIGPARPRECTLLEWRVKHWGTKWTAYNVINHRDDCFRFKTANNPPLPVLNELSRLFPEIQMILEFVQESRMQWGIIEWRDGKVFNTIHYTEYDADPDWILYDRLAKDLIDYDYFLSMKDKISNAK